VDDQRKPPVSLFHVGVERNPSPRLGSTAPLGSPLPPSPGSLAVDQSLIGLHISPLPAVAMVTESGSGSHGGHRRNGEDGVNVSDLLGRLHLTKDEEEFVAFSDDEETTNDGGSLDFTTIGKVLSPSTLHISTITSAMRPAWGNPVGLILRSVGERVDNMFIEEFGTDFDRQKALEGTPWLVGCYAVILQEYDEPLKPSNVSFSTVTMWVRILDLPFGWMNAKRGARVVGLIGEVQKVEADSEGKVSGPFLRARVVIDISKPLRRGILLKKDKSSAPRIGLIFSMKTCLSSACLVVTLGIFSQLVLPFRPGMQMGNCHMNIRNFVR
jgi:hypothetical protein